LFIEQRGELVASLLHAVTADSGQWIFAANHHAQNGIAPLKAVAGLAFSPSRGQFSAQMDEAADHLGQIVVDLIGPVIECTVERRDRRAATICTH
jgi:hypothetical protein